LTFIDAASLPLVSMTILQGLASFEKTHSKATDATKTVLIHGGAGGLGTFAIQYCVNVLGLTVFSTCSPSNNELVQLLGATTCIDYHTVDWSNYKQAFDVIIDTKSYIYESITSEYQLLKPDGHYINIASSPNTFTKTEKDPFSISIPEARFDRVVYLLWKQIQSNVLSKFSISTPSYTSVIVQPSLYMLERVAELLAEHKIRAVIDRTYTICEVADAHVYVETGHAKGKVVIVIK
jgi:alcohol dehydrogenase